MHPSKAHSTMAPPSEGLHLGFTDVRPTTRRDIELPSGVNQMTPTKTTILPTTPFTFSVSRASADPGLSAQAKKMLEDLRGDAAKIKANLVAQRERDGYNADTSGRKFATPKGKSGRFSAAHEKAFEKMDSIANHPSAFRAKLTPIAGIKRSSSRANLDDLPSSVTRRSAIKRSPSKAKLDEAETPRSPHFRVRAVPSSVRNRAAAIEAAESNPPTPAKRLKQRIEDDASSSRPVSRDGSSIPRPKSSGKDTGATLTHSKSTMSLASPAKATLMRAAARGPTITAISTPPKSEAHSLRKSATTSNLKESMTPSRRIFSPGRLDRVKSILKNRKGDSDKPGSALPLPSMPVSKTPAPPRVNKALPPLPATTPRRRLIKNPSVTPSGREAVKMQNSPSPAPTSFFRSLSKSVRGPASDARMPNLGSVLAGSSKKSAANKGGEVVYPDLSVFSGLQGEDSTTMAPPSRAGTFTFRSDHTINFSGESPAGFGASPGQASVRHVRPSTLPIPGSFPSVEASIVDDGADARSGNKENRSPVGPKLPGISHGMHSKKRHRPTTDEEDEAAERAAKKSKNEHVPEGDALLAPRLMAKPGRGKGACRLDSPAKKSVVPRSGVQPARTPKKTGITMSRLNMLARPKNRD